VDAPPIRHVVVVGGGISGLAAAYALRREIPSLHVTVVEESGRLGGKLFTGELGGSAVENGADNWLARVPDATRLAEQAGLAGELVTPGTGSAWVRIGDNLRRFPEGTVRGVPARLWPLATARVLSPYGLLRAAAEPWLPGRPVEPDAEATVGDVVRRRLGRQVVDRLVEPLLGGVYAGRADDLDLDAAAPDLATLARSQRSLVRAARERRKFAAPREESVFRSVRGGLTSYVDAVARAARVELLTNTRAATVERLSGGFRVTLAGGRALIADGVVVATPARAAARLLELVAPPAATPLRDLAYASVALVGLAYRGDVKLPPGSGILVPPRDDRIVKAVTFYGQKWPHVRREGITLLRASVGRAGEPVTYDDADLVTAVTAELRRVLRLPARPYDAFVARWDDALPQYGLGHLTRVEAVETAVDGVPGLAVAGAAYRGVGIAACVASGEAAAARVAAHVRTRG
jgi:protoporphyrinogen/coproporphyrinogen III oxidase